MPLPMMRATEEDILTLEEIKQWLRIDHDEEDTLLLTLKETARQYLRNATGREWSRTNQVARQVMLCLIADMYENRELTVSRNGGMANLRPAIQSMIVQLQYEPSVEEMATS